MAWEGLYTIRRVRPITTTSPIHTMQLSIKGEEGERKGMEIRAETGVRYGYRAREADTSLTNQKPSAIYRLRPTLPPDAPLPSSTPSQAANLGIEIAPLQQLENLLSTIGSGEGKGKEVAGKVDVGKVAEKVVKNVCPFCFIRRVTAILDCFSVSLSIYGLRNEVNDSYSITYILSVGM